MDYRRSGPLAAVAAVIVVNAAAVLLPINGLSTGALADLNPTGFTPSGYVFSIWSLIYAGLIAFAVSQLVGGEPLRARGGAILPAFYINAAGNIAWILAWHYRQVPLSFLIMLAILGSLGAIYRTLRRQGRPDWRQFLTIDGPFSLYLGWITAATILNLAAVFFDRGAYPFGLEMDQWALVSVAAATGIYAWLGASSRDPVYAAVFVWAAGGIVAKADAIGEPVRLVALTGGLVIAALVTWIAVSRLAAAR
jgi:benzodiazapine receptor